MLRDLPICLLLLQVIFGVAFSTSTLGADIICNRIPGLTDKQREMCRVAPDAMVAIGKGVSTGLQLCQELFRNHRWNCSAIGWPNVFSHVVVVGSREAAFTYGVSSAGVAYEVTAACSRGNISSCGCDPEHQQRRDTSSKGWKWGGCSADVGFGMRFARKFLDAREIEGDARSLMNLHNNKAGRKAVKSNLVTECKCHGVSGSCTMRTCWEALPPFKQIGDTLMKKYNRAKPVMAVQLGVSPRSTSKMFRLRPVKLVLRKTRSHGTAPPVAIPKKSELVFLQSSPNYCERDPLTGSLGTIGRFCNRTSRETDGCDIMCCGRGYNTHQHIKILKCNCRFHWCCLVHCEDCSQRIEEYTCK